MSVNRKRNESCCIKCHNARPSRFGRWCNPCFQKLTHEEQLAAADEAALADDRDPRLAPNRLARKGEGNGNGRPAMNYLVVTPETTAESQALKREGWEFSHFTALGTRVWKRAR